MERLRRWFRQRKEGAIQGQGQARLVDLVFVIDGTGSMSDDIEKVKENLDIIINTLITELSRRNIPAQIRFSMVLYRDHPPEDNRLVEIPVTWTTDINEIKKHIKSIVVSGGGDTPEAVGDGLKAALELGWRGDHRVLLLIGDAPPHGKRYHDGRCDDRWPEGCPVGNDPCEVAAQLYKQGVILFAISCHGIADKAFKMIAEAAHGYFLSIRDARQAIVTKILELLRVRAVAVIELDEAIIICFSRVGAVKTRADVKHLCELISSMINRPVDPREVARRMMALIERKKIDKRAVDTGLLFNITKHGL